MRNKRKKGGLLTVAMIWAAFATTNYNPAMALDHTINNYENLNKALSGQEFEDSGNLSTLLEGDTVIMEGNITSTSPITTAVNNVTLNGSGNTYSAENSSLNGFVINTEKQTIENITINNFNNAINVESNCSLTLTDTTFGNNSTDIVNSGNITLTGNNTLGTITGTGSLTNSGNLTLNNKADISNISQTTGSITTSGNATISNSNISNGSINVSGNGNLDFKGGTLGRDTQLAINSGSTFTNSGNATLNNNDTLNGSFKQSTGSLNLAGATTNGKLSLDGGEVNVTGNQTLTGDDTIGSGGDTIGSDVDLTVDATLTNDGGTINLDSQDLITSNGSISQTSGTINANNFATAANGGSLKVNGGSLIISSDGLTLNNANDNIADGATVNMNGNLTIDNGSVSLSSSDNLENGTIKQTNGSLSLDGVSTGDVNLNSTGGNLNLTNVILNNSNDSISSTVNATIGGNLTVNNGSITLNTGDNLGNGTITQNGGSLTISDISTGSATLNSASGNLTLDGATIEGNDTIAGTVNTTIGVNGVTISNTSADGIILNNGDTINGTVDQQGGNLSLAGVTTNGKLNSTGGKLNITGDQTLISGDTIGSGANLTVGATLTNDGGTINLNKGDKIESAGSISQTSGVINANNFSTTESGGGLQASGGSLQASGGSLNISSVGLTLNNAKDNIEDGATVNMNGNLTIKNGSVSLSSSDNLENGTIKQTNGTLKLNGIKTGDISLNSTDGNLNLTNTTLNNSNDSISSEVNATIGGDLTINNGSITLNTGDNLGNGTISQKGGNLTIIDISTGNSTLDANSGNLTLNGATLTGNDTIAGTVNTTIGANGVTISNTSADGIILNNGDTINGTVDQQGGNLSLAGVTTKGNLSLDDGVVNVTGNQTLIGGDTIGSGVDLKVGATLTNEGGTINLDSQDSISNNGSISQTSGTINADNFATAADGGSLKVNGGSLIISSDGLTLNNADDNIADGATVNMNGNLTINNGSVSLGSSDSSSDNLNSGTMNLTTNGILNLNNITTENVNINAEGGTLQLSGVTLDNQNDNIEFGSNVTFNGDVNITKGNVEIDSGDTLTTGEITLNQAAGATATLGVDGLKTGVVTLNLQEGTLNIINNGLELDNTSDVIQKEIITNVDGNLTINEGKVLLNEGDSWKSGIVSVSSNGKLQFENFEATSNSDTTLKMDGADSVTELLSSTVTFGNAENISNGTIAIDYDSGILIQSGSYNLSEMKTSGSISTINGGYENHTANTMTILNNTTTSAISNNDIAGDGFAAFGVDLYARNANKLQNSDVFKGTDLTLSDTNGTGEVYIADYVLNGNLHRGDAPIDRYYNFKIFDYENVDPNIVFSSTDKETFTPIGYYKLTSNGDGSYTLGLARYNKQVFRLQATTLAQYNNQLAINDIVTSHHILHGERQLANANSNRFAAATPNLGPYQYGQQEGGLWFKSYADIERLSMTQDLNVHNTAYGAIIGADFPIVNLKKGWKFIPTPYIGYNGAHQSFNDVSAYQTGGQLGFMGTFMKNNYISSHTIYGGGYYNEMHVDNVLDNTGNWFWGTAHRFAYNWNIKRNFIIQPNFLASYNMFGEQNLHSDFGAMGMRSGMLNGVNIAPGLNFIYAKDDWSLYLGAQYLYNINEQVSGRAGNVYLPNLNMRHGYIQYGIGATKNIKDDLSTYAQVMIRNGGRTGIAFQLGLQYYFDIHEIGSKIKNGYNIAAEKIKNIKK